MLPGPQPRTAAGARSLIPLALIAIASLCAWGPPAAGASVRPQVAAATSGPNSELRKTIPITRRPAAGPRIVLSIGPGRLSGLQAGDRLELSSEVQVTVDCDVRQPRCAGRPYRFDPTVIATLELAPRRSPEGPSRTLARTKLTCRQQLPNRQHHCPIVFAETIRAGDRFPCRLDSCFANVVVSAHSRRADGGQRMIIGSNKPNGRIVQDKGRLNAILLGPGVTAERLRTRRLRRRSLRLRPRRKVVLSQRIDAPERGEVLAVSASIRSDVRRLGYNALVGAELIVARGPNATSPSRLVRRSVWQQGQISPINGTNCTPIQSPCRTRKVGVVKVRRDVRGGSGASAPLFVNLVMRTKQKRVEREHGARLRLRHSSGLEVRRYP